MQTKCNCKPGLWCFYISEDLTGFRETGADVNKTRTRSQAKMGKQLNDTVDTYSLWIQDQNSAKMCEGPIKPKPTLSWDWPSLSIAFKVMQAGSTNWTISLEEQGLLDTATEPQLGLLCRPQL